jgi:hypothetical protein
LFLSYWKGTTAIITSGNKYRFIRLASLYLAFVHAGAWLAAAHMLRDLASLTTSIIPLNIMDNSIKSMLDLHELFCDDIRNRYPKKRANQIISEVESGLIRLVLPTVGFNLPQGQTKITKSIKCQARDFMAKFSISRLPKAVTRFEAYLPEAPVTESSRNTYGNRVRQWFVWAGQTRYWPGAPMSSEMAAQCAPLSLHGHGSITTVKLTQRRGIYRTYGLKVEEMNPALRQWYEDACTFLSRTNQPGRPFGPIAPYTLRCYSLTWRLILGWQHRYNGVPLEALGPQHIFPMVDLDELEQMTPAQQAKCWRKAQRELETIICGYRDFLIQEMQAFSPHTWHLKLVHTMAAGRVLYADWVTVADDYEQLPLFKTIRAAYGEIQEAVNERQRSMDVACLAQKWPHVPEGSTALEVFQQGVTEPMRLDCRPRTYSRKLRSPRRIAHRFQQFLRVAYMSWIPPLRQQVDRSLKIALSCPIVRPQEVPPDGVYYPLPPDEVRQRNGVGQVDDNYVYHSYVLNGRRYPEGIWIREVRQQKTRKSLGIHRTIIPNRRFDDGSCLYDYQATYLEGLWWPSSQGRKPYAGSDPRYQDTRGEWLSTGRAECKPQHDTVLTDGDGVPWRVGFLFVSPTTGRPYCEYSYLHTIRTNAHRLIGRAVTPHTMRYFWATWAYQVGLSDQEIRSLAFMMGHSPDTLRRMYAKMTPDEQQRPIEDAILARLCRSDSEEDAIPLNRILRALHHLDQAQLRQVSHQVQKLLDGGDAGAMVPV